MNRLELAMLAGANALQNDRRYDRATYALRLPDHTETITFEEASTLLIMAAESGMMEEYHDSEQVEL